MNPYEPPLSTPIPDAHGETSSPAQYFLRLFGWFYTVSSPLAFLYGLQAGLQIAIASATVLVLACWTIWLANRRFTPLIRLTTFIWGLCLIAFFILAIAMALNSSWSGWTFFLAIELLFAVPIPILALRKTARKKLNILTRFSG